jgi:hypothetical protein
MLIEQLIGNLLMRNNCVVIPGFGGFVASHISAQVDFKSGVISPPKKALTFNKNLQNNDGLLITEYAKQHQLSFHTSQEVVNLFVKSIQQLLSAGERVTFDKVGFLYQDERGAIRFEQDRFFNLLMESYGLGQIKFIPENEGSHIENQPASLVRTEIFTLEKETSSTELPPVVIHPSAGSTFKKLTKYVAAAALLPVLFYSLWIPTTTDVLQSGVVFRQDFNPLKQKPNNIYTKTNLSSNFSIEELPENEVNLIEYLDNLPQSVTNYSFELNEDTYIPVKLPSKNIHVQTSNTPSSVYHLIAGCFGNKENADNLITDLAQQGYRAFIVDIHKGLHRVSVVQGNSHNELNIHREKLEQDGVKTWLLKK